MAPVYANCKRTGPGESLQPHSHPESAARRHIANPQQPLAEPIGPQAIFANHHSTPTPPISARRRHHPSPTASGSNLPASPARSTEIDESQIAPSSSGSATVPRQILTWPIPLEAGTVQKVLEGSTINGWSQSRRLLQAKRSPVDQASHPPSHAPRPSQNSHDLPSELPGYSQAVMPFPSTAPVVTPRQRIALTKDHIDSLLKDLLPQITREATHTKGVVNPYELHHNPSSAEDFSLLDSHQRSSYQGYSGIGSVTSFASSPPDTPYSIPSLSASSPTPSLKRLRTASFGSTSGDIRRRRDNNNKSCSNVEKRIAFASSIIDDSARKMKEKLPQDLQNVIPDLASTILPEELRPKVVKGKGKGKAVEGDTTEETVKWRKLLQAGVTDALYYKDRETRLQQVQVQYAHLAQENTALRQENQRLVTESQRLRNEISMLNQRVSDTQTQLDILVRIPSP